MATQYTGTWAPSNGFLPIITDSEIQFAAYYVTEPGTFNGITYSLGDWLIYIDDSTDKWFKSTGGIVSFNLSSSSMSPDPGTYTKVILGQNGSIIEASTLSSSDLPTHKHSLSDIDSTTLPAAIYTSLKKIFSNSEDNLVKFKFDDKLKTLSADVQIDEVSVKKNNYGQLYSDGTIANEEGEETGTASSGGTTTTPVTISIENVTSLSKRLASIESQIALNKILASGNSAIKLVQEAGGTYADVKFDGLSIIKNSEGELCINPDLLSVYTINGLNVTTNPDGTSSGSVGGTCGNFTLTADEIEGLDTYFEKKIVEYTKLFTVSASNLPIDEDTIIINSEGKLSAVFSKVTSHNHKLADITDFPTEYLQYASLQVLHNDINNPIDFTKGKFNISGYTIGNVLEIYNQEFVTLQDEIDALKLISGKVEPGEPPYIDSVSISLDSQSINVYDTESSSIVSSYYDLVTTTVSSKFYPHNKGTLEVLIDGVPVAAIELNDNIQLGDSNNGLSIEKLEDYYKEIPGFMGTYKGIAISYKSKDLLEGLHTLQYRHIINSSIYETKKVSFNYVVNSHPQIESIHITMPNMTQYVSGVPSAKINSNANVTVYLTKVMSSKYIPIDFGYLTYVDITTKTENTIKLSLDSLSSVNKEIVAKPISIILPSSYSGNITVSSSAKDIFGSIVNTISESSSYVRFDSSTVESYRYVYVDDDIDNYPPNDLTSPVLEKFDPNMSLTGSDERYKKELQIVNDIAVFKYSNYLSYGGPDYSVLESTICEGSSVRWITLVIPCEERIFNGYVDLYDGGGFAFNKNLDGTLRDIFIWVSPINMSTMIANNWLNLNKPFSGYSSFNYQDKNYYGLDLSRSGLNRRWFTFGRKPLAMNYNALVIKIALAEGKSLNIKKVISSIEESINGQL